MSTSFFAKYQIAIIVTSVVVIMVIFGAVVNYLSDKNAKTTNISGETVKTTFPPWVSFCPDYWVTNGDKSCSPGVYGNYQPLPCNSSVRKVRSINDRVQLQDLTWVDKCKWANSCSVLWEGVSDKPCIDDSFKDYASSSSSSS